MKSLLKKGGMSLVGVGAGSVSGKKMSHFE